MMLVVEPALAAGSPGTIEMQELASPADRPEQGFGRAARGAPTRKPSDRTLIRAAQRGSTEALELLFRRHWPRAHRAAYLIVHDGAAAEDIAQEAFLAAVRALDRFDRRRPFAPWLNRIVVNRAIDWSRARSLRRETGSERLPEPRSDPARGSFPGELVEALAALSPDQRAVVVMRYLLEYTPGEIARVLELPRGTVNSRLRRGLDTLEGRLREVEW
jgi:RNA polymerase sigma-70 factor, ECF subfamily